MGKRLGKEGWKVRYCNICNFGVLWYTAHSFDVMKKTKYMQYMQ